MQYNIIQTRRTLLWQYITAKTSKKKQLKPIWQAINQYNNLPVILILPKVLLANTKKNATTNTTAENNEAKEIRRLNRLLNEKVILHSDQGVQFTSWEFVSFCKDNNVTQSMSKAGCPYDNAPMERFYNTFKSNFYNVTLFSNVEMMDELTAKYINRYNYVRPHSYNNYLTPMEARYRQIFIEQSVTKKLDQYRGHFGADRGALAKLETLADEKFGQQELYPDFDI